jgi:serine protease AprX
MGPVRWSTAVGFTLLLFAPTSTVAGPAPTGEGIVVAVLDTGIDYLHPDLEGRVIERVYVKWLPEVGVVVVPSEVPPGDGHGTHVAGILGGTGAAGGPGGVAPGVKFVDVASIDASYPVDVPVSHALAALAWLRDNYDRLGVRVVNNSWGNARIAGVGCEDHVVARALREIDDPRLLWVFAAGNNGPAEDINVPACLPEVLTVGAVDSSGDVWNGSSRGPTPEGVMKPDVVALGVGVTSAEPVEFCQPLACDDDGYGQRTGTSMAAPWVSGIAALLMEENPEWTADEVKQRIISDAGEPWTADRGHGLAKLPLRAGTTVPVGDSDTTGQDEASKGLPNTTAWLPLVLLAIAALVRRRGSHG